MFVRHVLAAGLLVLGCALGGARAEGIDPIAGLLRAPLDVPIVLPDGTRSRLEGLVMRPDRPGRFPLVVMIHGTPRSEPGKLQVSLAAVSPASFNTAAIAFARRGYATVAVLRRGFGHSDGPYAEDYAAASRCESRDYLPVARTSGQDVAAATATLRREPWADPDRVLLLGVSTGGVAVTAALAQGVPGVRGAIDFAGGRGSSAPDTVCNPGGLVATLGALGRTARLPALWIYAENDHFFAPDLARRMHEAYVAAGAPADLAMQPPFAKDGHTLVSAAPEALWWPSVEPFLTRLGLPTAAVIPLPDLAPLPPPPVRSEVCRTGFRTFQDARTPAKAFAVSAGGGCGFVTQARTPADAEANALARCMAATPGPCRIYALGQVLVRE